MTEKRGEIMKRKKEPVVRSETALDYARDSFQAGTILERMEPDLRATVALLTRGYGLDPLAGDVNILGTQDKPTIYITKQAWMKRLTSDPRYAGPVESRPMTTEELKIYGNGDEGEVGWMWSCKMEGFAKVVSGWGTASPNNVKLQNVSKVTDRRILLRMAEKRSQHDAAPQAVSFALDPTIWDRADSAMRDRLQAAAEKVTVAMDDGITDPEHVARLAEARLIPEKTPPTVAEVFDGAPDPKGLEENAKPEDHPPVTDVQPPPDKCPSCAGPLMGGETEKCPHCHRSLREPPAEKDEESPAPVSNGAQGELFAGKSDGEMRQDLYSMLIELSKSDKNPGGNPEVADRLLIHYAKVDDLKALAGDDLVRVAAAVKQAVEARKIGA